MKIRNFMLIPISGLIFIGLVGTIANIIQKNSINKLLKSYVEAENLFLNADRDLYQVKVAEEMLLNNNPEDETHKKGDTMHIENLKQSSDRIDKAFKIINSVELNTIKTQYDIKRKAWEEKTLKINKFSKNSEEIDFGRKIANGSGDIAFNDMRDYIDKATTYISEKKESVIKNAESISLYLTIGYIVLIAGITIFTYLLSKKFAKPIIDLSVLASKIANGDLNTKANSDYKGEVGILARAFNDLISNLNNVNSQISSLIMSAKSGNLSNRANSNALHGDFKKMVDGLNQTLDHIISPLNMASEFVDRISKGDLPDEIVDDYLGDYNSLKESLNRCVNSIQLMIDDSKFLSDAAKYGRLDDRADLTKHNGDFKKVIEGINFALDAVIDPLQTTSEMIKKISAGDIPPKLTQDFNGDYNYLKLRINQLIENLNGVFGQTDYLIDSIIDGNLDARGDYAKFEGAWSDLVKKLNTIIIEVENPIKEVVYVLDGLSINDYSRKMSNNYKGIWNELKISSDVNLERLEHLLEVIVEISNGDLQSHEELIKIGKRSDKDKMLPAIILLMKNIKNLITDINLLTEHALDGNLAFRVDADKQKGEYSAILKNINKLLDALNEPISEAGDVLQVMSTGDLSAKMVGKYRGDHEQLKNNINNLSSSLSNLILSVLDGVSITAEATERISSTSDTISASAAHQSSQTEEVASAVEEMTRTITENADSALQTSNVAKENGEIAKQGGKIVEQTVFKMRDIAKVVNESAQNIEKLGDSSKQIGEIISVIDDIADQTNLLALNAAIEAARAGEQGRGFAVVADEVRKLAERTTSATKEISSMIRSIQAETENAVTIMHNGNLEVTNGITLADQAGEALKNIVISSKQVIDMISHIASANEEQAATSEEISKNIVSISEVAHESARNIHEIASASDELKKMTFNLNDLMSRFKIDDDFNRHNSQKRIGSGKHKLLS